MTPDIHRAKPSPRFLLLDDVAEVLSTTRAQVYALVRSGELPAIKVGGRGQSRVERDKLEGYIAQAYIETERWVRENPLTGALEPTCGDRVTTRPSIPSHRAPYARPIAPSTADKAR